MIRRELGSTGMVISAVGFGAWAIGGWLWGEQDDADSRAAISAALEAGVNWIDTAPIYGSGRSERLVGDVLRALPSDRRPMVFTKFGLGEDSNAKHASATRAQVVAECDASLARLGVDRIDLYQLHWPVAQPVDEVAGACAGLLEAGKVRAIGVCNYSIAQLDAWQATRLPLHCLQTPYSLLRPTSGDTVLPWCAEHGLGGLAYSPLMRGMLFGTWSADKTFPSGDTRGEHKDYRGARFARHLLAIDELKLIAAEEEITLPQLAIGALMCTPGLTACIVGARNAAQGTAMGDLGSAIRAKPLQAVDEVCARLAKDLEGIA